LNFVVVAARFQQWWNKNVWDSSNLSPENTTSEERDGKIYSFQTQAPQPPIWTLEQILGSPSKGGQTVSFETALTISAYYRALSIKSGLLSSMPYKLYRKTKTGREEVKGYAPAEIFTGKTNSKMTKTVFLERAMIQYDNKGNHYGIPIRNGLGQVAAINYVMHDDVQVFETSEGVFYKIRGMENPLPASRMIHVPNMGDGIIGKGILQKAMEDFALQMNARDYGSGFFADGGKLQMMFLPKDGARPTDPQRAQLQKNYQDVKKKAKEFAVPAGWDVKEMSVAPMEAGFIGATQAGVADISRWTGVPLHKLADMSAATRNNVEHQNIEFLQDTMAPTGAKFENEHKVKLLTLESEQDMYYEFNWDAYIRPDTITKAEAFSKYIQNGVKTPNEVRAMNNDPAMPGTANELFIQGATVPMSLQEKMVTQKPQGPQARSKSGFTEEELYEMIGELELSKKTNGKH
jgi:HK97 family phage portal protein